MFRKMFATVVLASCLPSYAAPPSDASIEALLKVTQAERLSNNMMTGLQANLRQSMAAAVQGKDLTVDQKRVLDELPGKMAALMQEQMSWAHMRPMYVQIYKNVYSQDDVDGMLAFYQTAAGQALIEKAPLVMQMTLAQVQAMMPMLTEKLSSMMRQVVQDPHAP